MMISFPPASQLQEEEEEEVEEGGFEETRGNTVRRFSGQKARSVFQLQLSLSPPFNHCYTTWSIVRIITEDEAIRSSDI